MIDEELADQAKTEVKAIEETRILLGFLEAGEAIQRLHSSKILVNPVPPSEEQRLLNENEMDYLETHTRAETNVDTPAAPFRDSEIEVRELPSGSEIEEHLEEFRNDPHFQEVANNYPDDSWRLAQVPIESLVAFQKSVTKTTYDTIPTSDENGLVEVLNYTLPTGPTNMLMPEQIGHANAAYKGIQLISRDPNVQVAGPNVSQLTGQPTGTVSVEFLVRSTPNIAQVAHYEDRYILKNGYHRTYQLLRAGESHLPCFVLETDKWEETGGANPGHFNETVVMGDRPPILSDFDSDIAHDIQTPGKNTILKIVSETSRARR